MIIIYVWTEIRTVKISCQFIIMINFLIIAIKLEYIETWQIIRNFTLFFLHIYIILFDKR